MSSARLSSDSILFRCDGTVKTGLGHVSRCLALAEALQECGFAPRFLGRFEAGAAALLSSAGMPFESLTEETGTEEDALATIQEGKRCQAVGVVVDSYLVTDEYLATLDRKGAPTLLVDDFGQLDRYECSAVLNFTVDAALLDYPRGRQVYLLGPEYFLARRSLRVLRQAGRPRAGEVRRVLVAMGGVDLHDMSRKIANMLLAVAPSLSVHIAVGDDCRYRAELSSLIENFEGGGCVVTQPLGLAQEFAWADLCICGGGLTKYESAYVGVPAAVLSQTLEQAEETVHFAGKGLVIDWGLAEKQDDASLAKQFADLSAAVDVRASLRRASLACFPSDPTKRAAEGLVEVVSRSRTGSASAKPSRI